MTERSPLQQAIADVVIANHILAAQGIVDAFGHVSVRHPDRADRFLLSRNLAPALVSPQDVMQFDLDGNPCDGDERPVYLERFIHAALYHARADVHSVVHNHSRSVIPFGAVEHVPFKPVSHMAGFMGASVPCFEIRDAAGPCSDLLIRSLDLGAALATRLGDAPVVLMRGHGVTCVGTSIREAVFHAIYVEWNASILAQTMAIGTPIYLTPEEAAAAQNANAGQIGRAWDFWVSQLSDER